VYQAKWQQKVDSEMREMQRSLIEHHADKDQHLPFKDKIELFVPRTELEGRLMRIEKTLENIDKKLN